MEQKKDIKAVEESKEQVEAKKAEKTIKEAIHVAPEVKELQDLMTQDKTFVAVRQIMTLQNNFEQVRTTRQQAIAKANALCTDERISAVEARAMTIDEEALMKLDLKDKDAWEMVLAYYTFDDGVVTFTNNPDVKDLKIRQMHRDYLLYLKHIKEETEKFDIYEQKMQKDIENFMKEFEEACGEEEAAKLKDYASFTDYYLQWIKKLVERDDVSDKCKAFARGVLDAEEAGITLNFLLADIRKLIDRTGSTSSLLHGYSHNYREVATKADKILKAKYAKYKYDVQMGQFYDYEKRFFPEYEKYNNLFMFIIFRYIKYRYDALNNNNMITIGELLTQMGLMAKPKETWSENTKRFEEAYRAVMSLVINH